MNSSEYKEILAGVYERASFNKSLAEFKQGLPCYKYEELRDMLKRERLNYQLTGNEMEKQKAIAIDIEMTIRLLLK